MDYLYFNNTRPILAYEVNTKNCLICKKPARSWSGHVHDDADNIIFAGWCEDHRGNHSPGENSVDQESFISGCTSKTGCYGFYDGGPLIFRLAHHDCIVWQKTFKPKKSDALKGI